MVSAESDGRGYQVGEAGVPGLQWRPGIQLRFEVNGYDGLSDILNRRSVANPIVYRARYYNPVTGRFMSRDPLEGTPLIPATLHKYLYADGDPVNRVDPKGKGALLEFSLIVYFGSQRALAVAPVIAAGTCVGIKAVDYVLTAYSIEEAARTPELEPPDAKDFFLQQAEKNCALLFPEE